ncbi:MAG: cytochrome c family protein [Planctomycetes bacterium]|nr:cytochrome c family protein [Planctomycetota bacterium]
MALLVMVTSAAFGEDSKKQGKFIGADKCKNCHQAKKVGDQFGKWKAMKHAKAFETLASEEAKKLAKEKGIADPQKSEKCLKCHVTAFGEPADRVAKGFNPKLGVQCESCHGPGEKHFKARLAAAGDEEEGGGFEDEAEKAYTPLPEGEIVTHPPVQTCLGCHNEEGPSFKPFCFKKRFDEVQHWDPRKKRSEADVAAMKCQCGEKCECKKGDCGGSPDAKAH